MTNILRILQSRIQAIKEMESRVDQGGDMIYLRMLTCIAKRIRSFHTDCHHPIPGEDAGTVPGRESVHM
jgi:hypothetical protein